jgi:MFS family permease
VSSRTIAYAALLAGGVLALVASASAVGLSQALAMAALAGALLMLALRVRGRQVIGGALTALGLGIVVAGVIAALAGSGPWSVGYALAGALVVLGGIVALLTSPRWPSRAERFENRDEPIDLWRAQDAGLDPTVDRGDPEDPDVQKDAVRDRMT